MVGATGRQGFPGRPMILAQLTALMSKVGRRRPDLMQDRNVALFVQACIDEARDMDLVRESPRDRDPPAPSR